MSSSQNEFFIDGNTLIKCNPSVVNAKLPENITKIAKEAFKDCKDLESVELPANLEEIGESAFEECKKLKAIKIPPKITVLAPQTFSNCVELSSVDLPEGLTEIGQNVFHRCIKLTDLKLPQSLKTIGVEAFHGCGLTKLEVPENVDLIDFGAFKMCRNLVNIKLPAVCDLWGETFKGCSSLESIVIPTPAKKSILAEKAFEGCESLTSVEFLEGSDYINDRLFQGLRNLKTVKLPSTLKIIRPFAFESDIKIESIDLPEGLEEIGDRAFSLCSALKSITLPSTIRLLGQNIFAGSSVSEAHFNGTMAEWLKYVEKPRTRSAPWIRLDEVICKDGKADAHKKDSRIKIKGAESKKPAKAEESIGDFFKKMVANESKNLACIPLEEDGTLTLALLSFTSSMQVNLKYPTTEAEDLKNKLPGLLALMDSAADLNSVKDYINNNGLKASSIS